MERGDEVVDPEAALQVDQPLGDLAWRTDQKPVVEQLVEAVVKIVSRRHALVLTPR